MFELMTFLYEKQVTKSQTTSITPTELICPLKKERDKVKENDL